MLGELNKSRKLDILKASFKSIVLWTFPCQHLTHGRRVIWARLLSFCLHLNLEDKNLERLCREGFILLRQPSVKLNTC